MPTITKNPARRRTAAELRYLRRHADEPVWSMPRTCELKEDHRHCRCALAWRSGRRADDQRPVKQLVTVPVVRHPARSLTENGSPRFGHASVSVTALMVPEWSGPSRPPEELQLNVVRIAKGQYGVGGVGRFLDTGVAYAKFVQPRSPGIKIAALRHEELQMIKPDPELIEFAPA